MPTLMLTDRQIAAIKPTTTRVEYVDEKVPGLALRVTPKARRAGRCGIAIAAVCGG